MMLFRAVAAAMLGMALMAPIVPAQAQLAAQDSNAIRSVIERQIEAFRHDDGEGAFAFAAPSIRTMFGSAEAFMEMVRKAYQPVYRPSDIEFGDLSVERGIIAQKVRLVGPDGKPRTALYVMERQQDGSWRIAGCMLLEEPGRAT